MKRIQLLSLPALVALVLLQGCSSLPELDIQLSPYRVDVRQGNFVTPQMVAKLKPGQSKEQVRFVLGTPLVVDMFHGDRWDYIYLFQPGRGESEQRRLTVYFVDNKLARYEGDLAKAAADSGASSALTLMENQQRVIDIEPEEMRNMKVEGVMTTPTEQK